MTRRRKFAVALLILTAAVAVFQVATRWTARRTVERHLAAIRAMGYPATLEELEAWYVEPPRGENAAEVYEEAFRLARSAPGVDPGAFDLLPYVWEHAEVPALDRPFSPESLAASRKFLEDRREALAKLHEGASYPKARYPAELRQGPAMLLGHLEGVNQGLVLLALDAAVRAEQGDGGGALDSLCAAVRLAESLAEEPVASSQYTRIRGHELTLEVAQRVLSRTTPSPEAVSRLARAVVEAENRDTFYRAIVGEAVGELAHFTDEVQIRKSMPVVDVAWEVCPLIRAADFEYCASRLPAVLRAARGTIGERLQYARRGSSPLLMPPWYGIVSRYISGYEGSFLGHDVRRIANLRVARVGLALEQYRLAHGAVPNRLDELVPEFLDAVPPDAYTDGPLQYLPRGQGFLLYSVGPDGRDSGGLSHEQARERNLGYNAGDIVFEVRR